MSDYERVSGIIEKIDLTLWDEDVEAWAEDFISKRGDFQKATIRKVEWDMSMVDCVRDMYDDIMFLNDEPYVLISKTEHDDIDFSIVNDIGNDRFEFHCLWYNGGASLEEAIEGGMK